jgi:hypothetical protein
MAKLLSLPYWLTDRQSMQAHGMEYLREVELFAELVEHINSVEDRMGYILT